jgi:hypothetical protein
MRIGEIEREGAPYVRGGGLEYLGLHQVGVLVVEPDVGVVGVGQAVGRHPVLQHKAQGHLNHLWL